MSVNAYISSEQPILYAFLDYDFWKQKGKLIVYMIVYMIVYIIVYGLYKIAYVSKKWRKRLPSELALLPCLCQYMVVSTCYRIMSPSYLEIHPRILRSPEVTWEPTSYASDRYQLHTPGQEQSI